jgi:hypothetical protein
MDGFQVFYLCLLSPPVLVILLWFGVQPTRETQWQDERLDVEDILVLAAVPHSLAMVFHVHNSALSWFWFFYMSFAALVTIFAYRRSVRGWKKHSGLAFSTLYFGAHLFLYGFIDLLGAPPL